MIKFSANKYWSGHYDPSDLKSAENRFHAGWKQYMPAWSVSDISEEELIYIRSWAQKYENAEYKDLILMGMGGSSLGAKVVYESLRHRAEKNDKKIFFWEGTHPDLIRKSLKQIKERATLGIFNSKSGTTLETLSMLALFREFFPEYPVAFVTSEYEKIAPLQKKYEPVFQIPKSLGGRFSVFSPVGLLPAVFLGAETSQMLDPFSGMRDKIELASPLDSNPAKIMALELYGLLTSGKHTAVIWVYDTRLLPFAAWLTQLWGESLGKNRLIAALPVTVTGPEDQHSLLQYHMDGPMNYLHLFLDTENYGGEDYAVSRDFPVLSAGKTVTDILSAQRRSIQSALTEKHRPVAEILIPEMNLERMSRLMTFWMGVITYLGYLFNINPFDQPGVERGKILCQDIIKGKIKDSSLSPSLEI